MTKKSYRFCSFGSGHRVGNKLLTNHYIRVTKDRMNEIAERDYYGNALFCDEYHVSQLGMVWAEDMKEISERDYLIYKWIGRTTRRQIERTEDNDLVLIDHEKKMFYCIRGSDTCRLLIPSDYERMEVDGMALYDMINRSLVTILFTSNEKNANVYSNAVLRVVPDELKQLENNNADRV